MKILIQFHVHESWIDQSINCQLTDRKNDLQNLKKKKQKYYIFYRFSNVRVSCFTLSYDSKFNIFHFGLGCSEKQSI